MDSKEESARRNGPVAGKARPRESVLIQTLQRSFYEVIVLAVVIGILANLVAFWLQRLSFVAALLVAAALIGVAIWIFGRIVGKSVASEYLVPAAFLYDPYNRMVAPTPNLNDWTAAGWSAKSIPWGSAASMMAVAMRPEASNGSVSDELAHTEAKDIEADWELALNGIEYAILAFLSRSHKVGWAVAEEMHHGGFTTRSMVRTDARQVTIESLPRELRKNPFISDLKIHENDVFPWLFELPPRTKISYARQSSEPAGNRAIVLENPFVRLVITFSTYSTRSLWGDEERSTKYFILRPRFKISVTSNPWRVYSTTAAQHRAWADDLTRSLVQYFSP